MYQGTKNATSRALPPRHRFRMGLVIKVSSITRYQNCNSSNKISEVNSGLPFDGWLNDRNPPARYLITGRLELVGPPAFGALFDILQLHRVIDRLQRTPREFQADEVSEWAA